MGTCMGVSILVVVDSLLQHTYKHPESYPLSDCFNPCCSGFIIATHPTPRIPFFQRVSILVVVDSLLQLKFARCHVDHNHGFNPCCSGFIIATDTGTFTL